MGNSTHRGDVVSLPKAIGIYIDERNQALDDLGLKLLRRMARNHQCAAAFKMLKVTTQSEIDGILTTCLGAEQLVRTFTLRMASATATLARIDRVEKALLALRKFVDWISSKEGNTFSASDLLSAKILEPSANISAMRRGLILIGDHAAARRRVATEDRGRLGATRNKHMKQAAQLAAIVWLADGVLRVTGRPRYRAVASLASVILGREVSLDHVRNSVRERDREWRLPINRDPELVQKRYVRPSKKV